MFRVSGGSSESQGKFRDLRASCGGLVSVGKGWTFNLGGVGTPFRELGLPGEKSRANSPDVLKP